MPSDFIRQQRTERRRELRRNVTPAEAKLWWYLQNRRLNGNKFRRQHHIGFYILDFYCAKFCLAVEVDGDTHYTEAGRRHDFIRDRYLTQLGIKVIRFTNQEIYYDLDSVLRKIKTLLTPPSPR